MRPLGRVFPAVLAAMLVTVGSNGAYVLDEDGSGHPLHWRRMPVDYHLVRSNVPDGSAGEDAVHRAFRSWADASSGVDYRFEGFLEDGAQRNDGRNLVYWIHDDWPYDPALIASTFRTFNTSNGRLIDADIVVNGDGVEWSVGGHFSYDIENTLAHEVGHLNGLGHSNDSRATMAQGTVFGETKKRSLAEDDIAGLNVLYGEGSRTATGNRAAGLADAGGNSGCAIGRSSHSDAGEMTWLAGLLLALRFRHRERPVSFSRLVD